MNNGAGGADDADNANLVVTETVSNNGADRADRAKPHRTVTAVLR